MLYLYGVHKLNAMGEIVSVCEFQLENCWTEIDKILN
jgi:hypothetical protein